ncbi:MAG: pyridoxal phosphate-dependent aminotransferase [Bacteroidales bacterium]|jgi:aspartate/methionine/tyrosine aminotransferase|nr:pyridoxal phosphate-dependent aminotransferase [Bacteroidales bacterium]
MQNKYRKPIGSYIGFMSNKVKTYGGINLAQGIPGFDPPKELTDILSEIAGNKIHQYAPGNGNNELLDLLLNKYKKEFPFTKDDFLILQGATEALSLLYTYFNKIIPKPFAALAFDPVYESYKYLPEIFNTDFVPFSFEKDSSIEFGKLERTIVKNNVKVIFLGSPGNPFGKIWTKQEINSLLELSKLLNIYIVLDAVYKELYFDEKPYIPLEQFDSNIFYTNSFSKIFSITGWRVGYLIAHKDHMQKIKSIHDYTGLCASSVLQQALVEYLKKYDFGNDYILNLRNKLKDSYYHLSSELEKLGFEIPETKGGYFVWAKLPEKYSEGFKFAIDLYDQQKVAVIPGEHFSDNATNYIRLNIAREKSEVEEGIKRIKKFFTIS